MRIIFIHHPSQLFTRLPSACRSDLPARRALLFSLALAALFVFAVGSTQAQDKQYTENKADQALRSDARVDPSTLGMSLAIPLGAYPGRAGNSLPVALSYSSKVWRNEYEGSYQSYLATYTHLGARFAEHSVAGWTSTLTPPTLEFTGEDQFYDLTGHPVSDLDSSYATKYYIRRIHIHLPDGSAHELRKDDDAHDFNDLAPNYDWTGSFYAVDGSRMRYDFSSNTLYLADGSRYLFDPTRSYNNDQGKDELRATQYVDRQGNMLAYNPGTRQWTDTLGRVINSPLAAASTWGDVSYTLPGAGGSTNSYILKWRHLSEALTDPGQALRYTGDWFCEATTNTPASPYLFASNGTKTICAEAALFNPIVLAEVVLPTGQSYRFSYNVWGEMDKFYHPTGGYERFRYDKIAPLSRVTAPYNESNRGVVEHWVSAKGDGTDEARWQYSSSYPTGQPYTATETAPDGTRSERLLYVSTQGSVATFGFDNALAGRAYEERVFSPTGQMLRRKLTEWAVSSWTSPTYGHAATRNPRVTKEAAMLLDTGVNAQGAANPALANMTTYDYDTTYQFDVGPDQTWVRQYDYAGVDQTTAQTGAIASIPLGSLLRQTQTIYLTGNSSYRSRNLLNLPSSVMIYNGYGSLVATTDYVYDEAGYLLSDYPSVVNWVDPQTSARGNVTTVRRWLNTTNTRLDTHTQYDQCGSVRSAWDALGRQSQVSYASAYAYAYPTGMTSAVPDPTAAHASAVALTSGSTYDFSTGLVLTTTDANGKTTTLHYTDPQTGATDPLNRVRWIERPASGCGAGGASGCGTTTYVYGDTPGNLFVETLTSMDSTRTLDNSQYYDKLGRPSRTLINESGTCLMTDTQYDQMGRVWRVSNPFRSTQGVGGPVNPSGNWTTNAYDELGRVKTVTTADTAAVTTSYSGNTVTVTDQHDANVAGNSRQSVTDALGRLTQVIEDPGGLAYQTNYLYDVLGNLRMVSQGSQVRYYMYDSFSRLIRAKNPEQAANPNLTPAMTDPVSGNSAWSTSYDYDAAGNLQTRIDARGVRTDYAYDALNRNITVRYQNDPANTPTVDRYYDGAALGKGRLWQTITGGTANSYMAINSYDAMGRTLSERQQFLYNNSWSQNYTVGRSYDQAGHLLSQSYPDGRTVNYSYDAAGRTQSFAGNIGDGTQRTYSTGIIYNEWGLQQEQFGTLTPVYNKHFYNVRGQLAEIRESTVGGDTSWNRGAIINHYSGHCWGMCSVTPNSATDDNGNLKKQDAYIPRDDAITGYDVYTDFFQYDTLNRVQSARESLNGGAINWKQSYVYDQYGNRTIDQANTYGAGIPHLIFNVNTATNQLSVPSGQSGLMQHDASGNLYNDTYTGYGLRAFDAENRMVTARDTFGGTSSYSYDAGGRRVRRVSNNAEVWLVYGMDGELLSEYAVNAAPSTPQKEYGYRNGELLITAGASADLRWLITDQLGTPRMVLDQSGSLSGVQRHDYLPFGEELVAGTGGRTPSQGYAGDAVRQKFTGKERDNETGLDFMHARYYASGQGRFISPDLFGGNRFNPQTLNRYAYVRNNPLKLIDLTGYLAEYPDDQEPWSKPFGPHHGIPNGLSPSYCFCQGQEGPGQNKPKMPRPAAPAGVPEIPAGTPGEPTITEWHPIPPHRSFWSKLKSFFGFGGSGVAAASSWGRPETLPDHFDRHGPDFDSKSPEDYAQQAQDFLLRAQEEGLPSKLGPDQVLRVYDPESNSFAAYNMDGTTKTFFKPRWSKFTRGVYWDDQLGDETPLGRPAEPIESEIEIPDVEIPVEPIP